MENSWFETTRPLVCGEDREKLSREDACCDCSQKSFPYEFEMSATQKGPYFTLNSYFNRGDATGESRSY